MEIKVFRKPNDIGTPGQFIIDGANKWCSLELFSPPAGMVRVKGNCCVPVGKYKVAPRFEGDVFMWMKEKIPDVAKWGIPHIMNIDNVVYPYWIDQMGIQPEQYVLIHIGNTLKDTQGCCLVGLKSDTLNTIISSTAAFQSIYDQIKTPMTNGTLTIEYI